MSKKAKKVSDMTKAELGEFIDHEKFLHEIRCFDDDKLRNLIQEIFYEGMREGYELAKFRLELLNSFPFGSADEFLDENMEKIRKMLDLCKAYEDLEEEQ